MIDQVRSMCLRHPGASEKLSHGSPCFFTQKGRQFVSYVDNHHNDGRLALWLAAPPGVQESLIEENPVAYFRPPYVGHRGWVGANLDKGLSPDEVDGLIEAAYLTISR